MIFTMRGLRLRAALLARVPVATWIEEVVLVIINYRLPKNNTEKGCALACVCACTIAGARLLINAHR